MPGVISTIGVSAGQEVKAGDVLVSIEAMKMETAIHAERDGTIAEVLVAGDQIDAKDLLVVYGKRRHRPGLDLPQQHQDDDDQQDRADDAERGVAETAARGDRADQKQDQDNRRRIVPTSHDPRVPFGRLLESLGRRELK
jgi:pyruvate/2-oxoglutarate dehydrogenase complex dihydrolipoamide acyltransferase (E2) component